MLQLLRSVRIRAGDHLLSACSRRVADPVQRAVSQSRAVAKLVNTRAERLYRVKAAELPGVGRAAQKCVKNASRMRGFAFQLARKDSFHAVLKPYKVHMRMDPCTALRLQLACRTQDMVRITVVGAVRIREGDQLCALLFGALHIVKARQIQIPLAGDRIGRLKHVGGSAVRHGNAELGKNRAVE